MEFDNLVSGYIGSKCQLIRKYIDIFNNYIQVYKSNYYYEPFFGGGGFGIYFLKNYNFKKFVFNDINKNVYSLYLSIELYYDELERCLNILSIDIEQLKKDVASGKIKLSDNEYVNNSLQLICGNLNLHFKNVRKIYIDNKFKQLINKYNHIKNIIDKKSVTFFNSDYKHFFTSLFFNIRKNEKISYLIINDPPYLNTYNPYGSEWNKNNLEELIQLNMEAEKMVNKENGSNVVFFICENGLNNDVINLAKKYDLHIINVAKRYTGLAKNKGFEEILITNKILEKKFLFLC